MLSENVMAMVATCSMQYRTVSVLSEAIVAWVFSCTVSDFDMLDEDLELSAISS